MCGCATCTGGGEIQGRATPVSATQVHLSACPGTVLGYG